MVIFFANSTLGCIDGNGLPSIYSQNCLCAFGYTPLATSSYLSIEIMWNYTMSGSSDDNFSMYLFESTQAPNPPSGGVYYSGTIIGNTIHQDIGKGGLRSGTLMPMIFYFNANTTNTLKYYYVCANMMSSSGVQYTDDDLYFIAGSQQIKITEIKI